MQRRLLVAVLSALALAGGAGVVAAHGTHATATPQVSAGSVVVEEVALADPGYIVVRADEGGEPGRILGHRALDRGRHTAVTVTLDSGRLEGTGSRPVWAVVHTDDGDGQFEPDQDAMLYRFGSPAGDRFTARPGERPVYALTSGAGPAPEDGIPVLAAALARDGYLVAHAVENDTLGSVLGVRSVTAGQHADLRVPVSNTTGSRFAVAVYHDDGDGTFDAATDRLVRVGDDPVTSRYEVLPGNGDGTELGITVRTPTDTTPDSSASSGDTPVSRAVNTDNAAFGVVATVLALLVVLAVRRR